jgi:hypothetical protein
MAKQLIFEILDSDKKVTSSKVYKSLKDINKAYPDYTYHTLRQIYLQTSGLEPRKMHPSNQKLFSMIRIRDAPMKIF